MLSKNNNGVDFSQLNTDVEIGAEGARFRIKKILYFEDDEFISAVYIELLRRAGFVCVHSAVIPGDPQGLVDLVLKENPDLILMGIIMPDIDGFEACLILKSNYATKSIPIVGLDNLSQPEEIARAKEVGMKEYYVLAKYMPRVIVEKIKALCE